MSHVFSIQNTCRKVFWCSYVTSKTHEHVLTMSRVFFEFMCFMTKHMNTQNTWDMCYNVYKHVTCFFGVHVFWGKTCEHQNNMPCGKSVHVFFDGTYEHQKNMLHVRMVFLCFRETCFFEPWHMCLWKTRVDK